MKIINVLWIGIAVIAFLLCCGCISKEEPPSPAREQQTMGNPASLYCHSLGYQTQIRTDANGSQYGVCCMPNGTEVDEWALYRSAHPGT
ncbi:MAG: DUF333 domain-containing protein [Methanolinea sp.]|nr:DUF333 domain-containing protein [Methanolinea sp.]